jgi:hypothetical protein
MVVFTTEQRKPESNEETVQSIMGVASAFRPLRTVLCSCFFLVAHNLLFLVQIQRLTLISTVFHPNVYTSNAPNKLATEVTLCELPGSNLRQLSDCPD